MTSKTHDRLCEIMNKFRGDSGCEYELIFVEDGSRDNTSEVIINFCKKDKFSRYILF